MIEIVSIGDELVSGSTINTNAAQIAGALYAEGLTVSRITTVGDGVDDIVHALRGLLRDTRFVIATGGLGPTEDDRTAQAAARAFDRQLQLSPEAVAFMEKRFAELNRTMNPAHTKQALLPEGCLVVPNPVGTACGFVVVDGDRHVLFLPGVPEEVQALTDSFAVTYIKNIAKPRDVIANRTLKIFGIWESAIQERLKNALPASTIVTLGYYPQYPEISIKLTARGADPDSVHRELELFQEIIYDRIGDYIYSAGGEPLECVIGDLLKARTATLAVAESCTGGLITHQLTNAAGSSAYLERSVVAYSNRAKTELLQVPPEMLNRYGAVSEPVARSMAQGVRALAGTTFGLAVTGIAGPTGGSPEKPVGTVFIGVAGDNRTEASRHLFRGSRERIKVMTAHAALHLLRNILLGKPAPYDARPHA